MPSAEKPREVERPLRRRSLLALTAIRAPYLAVLRLHEVALFGLLSLAIAWAVSRTIDVRTDALPDPTVHERLWAFAWVIFAVRWTYLQWRERASAPRGQRFSLAWSAGVAFLLLEATSLVSSAAGLMVRRRLVDEGAAADAARDLEALANFVDANGKVPAMSWVSIPSLYDFAEVLEGNALEGARLPWNYGASPASRPDESPSAFGTDGPEVTKSLRPRRPICSLRELAIILEARERSRRGAAGPLNGKDDPDYNDPRAVNVLDGPGAVLTYATSVYGTLLRCPAGSDLYQIVAKYTGRRQLREVPIACFESECDLRSGSECYDVCDERGAIASLEESLGKNMKIGFCAAREGWQLGISCRPESSSLSFPSNTMAPMAILLSFIVGIAGVASFGNVALAAVIVGAIVLLVYYANSTFREYSLMYMSESDLVRLGLWLFCLYLVVAVVMVIRLRMNRGQSRADDVSLSVLVLGPPQLLCFVEIVDTPLARFAWILGLVCIGLMFVLPAPLLSKYRNLPRLS
jgi:hypothetical protein